MLSTVKKNVTLTGTSVIDGRAAEGYSATINSDKPEDVNFSSWQIDKTHYKENRIQCRKDSAEFEDMVYEEQERMMAAQTEEG